MEETKNCMGACNGGTWLPYAHIYTISNQYFYQGSSYVWILAAGKYSFYGSFAGLPNNLYGKKSFKAKSASTGVVNALGISMLWVASVGIFLFSLSIKPMISHETVVEKGSNFWGYYLVIDKMDNQSVRYKDYMYCSKGEYLDAKTNETYEMTYTYSTLLPVSYLDSQYNQLRGER